MLGAAVVFGLNSVIMSLAGGERHPVLYAAGLRLATAGCGLLFLWLAYRPLLRPGVLRSFLRLVAARPGYWLLWLLAAVGGVDMLLQLAAARWGAWGAAAVVYSTWPLWVAAGMALSWGRSLAGLVRRLWLPAAVCSAGLVFVVASRVGGFGGLAELSWGRLLPLLAGTAPALLGAVCVALRATLIGVGWRLARELDWGPAAAEVPTGFPLSLFACILLLSTGDLLNGMVLGLLVVAGGGGGGGLELGWSFVLGPVVTGMAVVVGNVCCQRANVLSGSAAVNVLGYLSPLAAVGGLLALGLAGAVLPGYLAVGGLLVVGGSLLGVLGPELGRWRKKLAAADEGTDCGS